MKLDKIANSGNDEFYTPSYAIKPILKYIPLYLQFGVRLTKRKVCLLKNLRKMIMK